MPNFHLHWLVAWKALDASPPASPARAGRDVYGGAARRMGRTLHAEVEELGALFSQESLVRTIRAARRDFDRVLASTPATADQVTCFSAFMLGACGPDFWTLPVGRGKPWVAPHHFNLGHYNRTHEQFRVSVAAVGNRAGLQADVERAYFLGMATHVAADLVVHELVNVYAGAYNLLKEDVWENEKGVTSVLVNLWNTHNKVEHFWDAYVRYRYLGDLSEHEPVFEGQGAAAKGDQLGFPLADTLPVIARSRNWVFRKLLDGVIGDEAIRVEMEAPLVLPMLACDRILGRWPVQRKGGPSFERVSPFIYTRVVDKQLGAYPGPDLYQDARDEAGHDQMRVAGIPGEHGKLEFFSREVNTGAVPAPLVSKQSQNFLTYYVGPDLAKLRTKKNGLVYGQNAFYDLPALDRFLSVAVDRAQRFVATLAGAYESANPAALGGLASFWNLDTGLGLRVENVPSDTTREVITRLDFLHILHADFGPAKLAYDRPAEPANPPVERFEYLTGKQKDSTAFSEVKQEAFPVRPRGREFADLASVQEEDDGRYLDRIRIDGAPLLRLAHQEIRSFFDRATKPPPASQEVASQKVQEENLFKTADVKHRLTLELRVPIASIGQSADEPAAFLYCDDALGIDRPAGAEAPAGSKSATKEQKKLEEAEQGKAKRAKNTHAWMHDRAHEPIFFAKATQDADGRLRYFTARILVNLEKEPFEKAGRVFAAPKWNNVVPHQASAKFYGRNFAIGTGRRYVLNPVGDDAFDPTIDFSYFDKVSPTEHVFLTIYPLVKTPGGEVVDAFSKEPVDFDTFDKKIRPISGLGWVKVVLLYVLGGNGALQLDRCYLDGLEVSVAQGRAELAR